MHFCTVFRSITFLSLLITTISVSAGGHDGDFDQKELAYAMQLSLSDKARNNGLSDADALAVTLALSERDVGRTGDGCCHPTLQAHGNEGEEGGKQEDEDLALAWQLDEQWCDESRKNRPTPVPSSRGIAKSHLAYDSKSDLTALRDEQKAIFALKHGKKAANLPPHGPCRIGQKGQSDAPTVQPQRSKKEVAISLQEISSARQKPSGECGLYALCNLAAIAQCYAKKESVNRNIGKICGNLLSTHCDCNSYLRNKELSKGFDWQQLVGGRGCLADTLGLDGVCLIGRWQTEQDGTKPPQRPMMALGMRSSGFWNNSGVPYTGKEVERHLYRCFIRPKEPAHFLIGITKHWVAASAIPNPRDGNWTIYYTDSGGVASLENAEVKEALAVIKGIITGNY